jgi:hypothetical protein
MNERAEARLIAEATAELANFDPLGFGASRNRLVAVPGGSSTVAGCGSSTVASDGSGGGGGIAATAQLPRGWLGPWIAESATTIDLLAEAGYQYVLDWCHDDQPTWLNTRTTRCQGDVGDLQLPHKSPSLPLQSPAMLAVPYPQE